MSAAADVGIGSARTSLIHGRRYRPLPERPMPATTSQLDDIKAVLRWARRTNVPAGERVSALAEALEAAIKIIEAQPNSLHAWVVGAFWASMRKHPTSGGHTWVVINRQLHDEALDTIEFLQSRPAPTRRTKA